MGRRDQATDTPPAPGAAAPTPGGRSPAPSRTRTGPGRDAAARIPAAPAQHDRPWTRPRCHRHGRTNLGPLAARPHLSPVPDRLPGRPTSDSGGPGLQRLYGYFRGGVLPEREQPVCRFTEEIRRLGGNFPPLFPQLKSGSAVFWFFTALSTAT